MITMVTGVTETATSSKVVGRSVALVILAALIILVSFWVGCETSDESSVNWSVGRISADGNYAIIERNIRDSTGPHLDRFVATIEDLPNLKYTIIDTLPYGFGWTSFTGGESVATLLVTKGSIELVVRRFVLPKRELTLVKSDATEPTAWPGQMTGNPTTLCTSSDTVLAYSTRAGVEVRSLAGDGSWELLGTIPDCRDPSFSADGSEITCVGTLSPADDYPGNTLLRFDMLTRSLSVACDPGELTVLECQSLGQGNDIFFLAYDKDLEAYNIFVCDLGGNYTPLIKSRYPEVVYSWSLTQQGIIYTVKNLVTEKERIAFLSRADW